jgi:hypothetical protein
MSRIPSYTVLNESIDENDQDLSWENMYQSNILSSSNISNFDVARPNYSQPNYDSLTGTGTPTMSKLYDDMLMNNQQTQDYMNKVGLFRNNPPYPPAQRIELPSMAQPPLNLTYPTDRYSPKDYSLASDSNYIQSTANIPVPLVAPPALKDSREQPSSVMPINNPIVIKHTQPEPVNQKENFFSNRDEFSSYHNPNCMNVYGHVHNCPMCMAYFTRNEKSLLIIIGFLLIIILVLLFMTYKK